MEAFARKAQAAAKTNRSRDLYKATKQLAGQNFTTGKSLRNKAEKMVTSKEKQLEI